MPAIPEAFLFYNFSLSYSQIQDSASELNNLFEGIRNNKPVIEDPIVGFQSAAPCLAAKYSYYQKKVINWDPEKMQLATV